MPLTMCAQLKALKCSAYAYHNHDYGYYDRDPLIPIWGMCTRRWKRPEITESWPESDLEMIDVTTGEYMNEEPFHAYYMTVSGHLEYNFQGNAMAAKNQALVEDAPYSEHVRAYLACQIELDRALELLLERLEGGRCGGQHRHCPHGGPLPLWPQAGGAKRAGRTHAGGKL